MCNCLGAVYIAVLNSGSVPIYIKNVALHGSVMRYFSTVSTYKAISGSVINLVAGSLMNSNEGLTCIFTN